MARSRKEMSVALMNAGKRYLTEMEITSGLTKAQHANIIMKFRRDEQPTEEEFFYALVDTKGALGNTSQFRQEFQKEGILTSQKKALEQEYYAG